MTDVDHRAEAVKLLELSGIANVVGSVRRGAVVTPEVRLHLLLAANAHASLADAAPVPAGCDVASYGQLAAIARGLDDQPPVAGSTCAVCNEDVCDPDDHDPGCAYRLAFRWVSDHPEPQAP